MNEQKKTTGNHRQKSASAVRQNSTDECQQTSTNAAQQKATINGRQNSTNECEKASTIASRQKTTRPSTVSRRRLRLILSILLVLAAFWLGRQDFLQSFLSPAGETQGTKVVEQGAENVKEQAAKEGAEQGQTSSDKPGDEKQAGQDSSVQEPAIQKSADQEPAAEDSAALESEDPRSPEFVASILRKTGKLPDRFLSKKEARKLGWVPEQGNLNELAPGKSIGGDHFGNYEGKLPEKKGRSYREADVHDSPNKRGAERRRYFLQILVGQEAASDAQHIGKFVFQLA